MNYIGVCRTVPATPGLLIMTAVLLDVFKIVFTAFFLTVFRGKKGGAGWDVGQGVCIINLP